MRSINYFTYKNKTIFLPFKFLYPECSILIKGEQKLYNLLCLKANCPRNKNCPEVLAKRVHYFFSEVEPLGELIISYFTHPNCGTSIKAGIFTKQLDEPRLITVNKSGFDKYRKESIIKQWSVTDEFINIGGYYPLDNIIPAGNLIKI